MLFDTLSVGTCLAIVFATSLVITRSRRAAGVPWGLLIGLAVFALSQSVLWSHGRLLETAARYTPPGPDGDPLRTAAALRELSKVPRESRQVVFLGSSQIREGVDCRVVAAALPGGERCTNLAVGGGSPLDMVSVLGALGPRGGSRVTVVGIFPKVLQMPPKSGFTSLATVPLLLRSGVWARLNGEEWRNLAAGLLQRLVPTLRFKDGLELAWRATDGNWRAAWRWGLPPQPERVMAGWDANPPIYFVRRAGVVDHQEFARGPTFGTTQEAALRTLADWEREWGNRIVVVDFPTRPGYSTTVPPWALEFYRTACERLRRDAGIVFVDAKELGPLSEEDFLDFTHLSDGGRAKVSGRLAALIRSLGAGRRSTVH